MSTLPPRRGKTGLLYLLLVLACTAVIVVDPIANRFAPPQAPPDPALTPTPEIEIFARCAIAAHALAPSVSTSQLLGTLDAERVDPVSVPVRTDRIAEIAAHLRTAIVVGEIEGPANALSRVDAVVPAIDALDPPDPELRADADALSRIFTDGPGSLTPEERARFTDRHTLLARIALTSGAPDTDPDRAAIVRASVRALLGLTGIAALGVIGMTVGFILLIVGIVLKASGKLPPRYVRDGTSPPRVHNTYLESMILFLTGLALFKAVSIVVGFLVQDPPPAVQIAMYAGYWVIALAAFWPRVRGVDWSTMRRSIGWTSGRGVVREIGAGIANYLAFLPIVGVGFFLVVVLSQFLHMRPSHPLVDEIPTASPWELVMLYSLAALWAPLVEESMFRGALYHHTRRFTGAVLSACFTAFLFAAIHPQGITTIPALMALALGFAACREWRSSLIGSMTGHALHNAVLITLNLLLFGG